MQETREPLDAENNEIQSLLRVLNGYDEGTSLPKASLVYQQYVNEDITNPELIRTTSISKLAMDISLDKYNPDFVRVRVMTRAPSEPQFRIFWASLLRHIKELSKPENVDKTPIFFLIAVSNQQIAESTEDAIASIQLTNPFSIRAYSQTLGKDSDTVELLYRLDNAIYDVSEGDYGLQDIKRDVDIEFEKKEIEQYNKKESERYANETDETF